MPYKPLMHMIAQARVCDEKPATLEVELFTGDVVQGPEQSDIAFFLLKLGGFYSKESQQMRGELLS